MFITPKRKAKFFKFLKVTRLPYLPFSLGIETGNICNLRCPLCPTGAQDATMKKGFMEPVLFEKIINHFKDNLTSINLYSWGEPLLNPYLVPMIKYAKESKENIRIVTSTNLNIKSDKLLSELVNSGIDEIIISCDGLTQETYCKYRVGGDYFLVSLQRQRKNKTKIIWNFLVFRHNEHEVEEAKRLAVSLGIELRLGKMRTYMKDEILKPHSESIRKYKDWIPDAAEYSAYDKEKEITKKSIKTCRKPWQEISINWDGCVFPCCAVYGDMYSYGNTKDDPVIAIWNNKLYMEARRQILDKKRPATTICGICRNNGFMHM